ncbi:MAG: methyl-accepting chemotaxis protein [Spirochaetes bacterium]|nr:methyl-accepting chemotaxis protein [Spirochaetota bacterium]
MKIRTKLLGGFAIVVVIVVFLGFLGMHINRTFDTLSIETVHLSETRTSISSILNTHYIWRHGLLQAVYACQPFTGSLDPRTCSLGAWLAGPEAQALDDPIFLSLLNDIHPPHDLIHWEAEVIVNLLADGEQEEAERVLQELVLPHTLQVIDILVRMQDRYGELLYNKMEETQQTSEMFQIVLIVAMLIALAIGIATALGITSNIIKPIVSVAGAIKIVAKGDLTKSVSVNSKDEMGDLAGDFNFSTEKTKELITGIKKQADELSRIGANLDRDMTETAAAVNEIAANTQSIKSRVINQSASVTQTNAVMEQIATNINKLNNHVEKQTDSVARSSSAVEEMISNIQSVTKTLVQNSENINALTAASELGRHGLQEVVQNIQEIAKDSEGLLEINAAMENVSSQTNLLSMNAAIQAAHAGEAGKGFAVVAGEIRKLAESSTKQSKTTSDVLKKIKSSIDKITLSTKNVLEKFEAIDHGVKTVAEQGENIRNAMEEQGHGSKQILDSISYLNDATQMVKDGTREMLEGAKEVIKETGNLEKITVEITGGMNEMAQGTNQINSAVHNVNGLSSENKENISSLIKEITRFKVQ